MITSVCRICAAAALTSALMTACSSDEGGGGGSENSVRFDPAVTIGTNQGTAVLLISGNTGTPWEARVVSGGNWVSFDLAGAQSRTGTVGETWQSREIPVYYQTNNTGDERHAQIEFTFAGEQPITLEMTQYSPGQNVYPVDHVKEWPELPAYKEGSDLIYVTHLCPVFNQLENKTYTGRNYTMCFDRTKYAAWWVAYPIHKAYLGSGRPEPDPWAFDPKFSSGWQANVISSSYKGNYDRGHQIPNADRNADPYGLMCYQTFYVSNLTPQNSTLNRGAWANLESKVRTWECSDTLYVVTGAWWDKNPSTVSNGKGEGAYPLPDYYFKAVVRTVKGNIRTKGDLLGNYDASQLKSLGFWVKNASGQGDAKQWATSVADLERKTGFTFFPSIPAAVKEQTETNSWGL